MKDDTTLTLRDGRVLTFEYRKGFGWYIMDGPITLMGFQTRKLLVAYLAKVAHTGRLHTPTARETYGR